MGQSGPSTPTDGFVAVRYRGIVFYRCVECGSLADNLIVHRQWHEHVERRIRAAASDGRELLA